MAVPAIDAVVSHVVRVAELKRLFDELVGARHVRRTSEDHDETDQAAGQEERADNTDVRESVGAATKDLRHRMLTVGAPAYRALTLIANYARRGQGAASFPRITLSFPWIDL